jgi:protein-S-isoprenylcysteine O-methyltransferase Ste14
MADAPRRMNAREIIIGIVVLLVVFAVVFFGAGALNLGLPQWLLSAISAVIGIFIWFALIGRLGGSKK